MFKAKTKETWKIYNDMPESLEPEEFNKQIMLIFSDGAVGKICRSEPI